MPQVGFGLWKVENAAAADTIYNAIKVGYRLFDGAAGRYKMLVFVRKQYSNPRQLSHWGREGGKRVQLGPLTRAPCENCPAKRESEQGPLLARCSEELSSCSGTKSGPGLTFKVPLSQDIAQVKSYRNNELTIFSLC